MQVVYSGGSTPSPSPRLTKKQFQGYGRPVLPGYTFAPKHSSHSRSPVKDKQQNETETSLRDSIPAMSKSMAIVCLICNILLPGLGTFISGLSVLCCSKVRLKDCSKTRVVLVNTWVALLQFLTAFILLLGWIWSIVWGTNFLTYTDDYYKMVKKGKDKKAPDKTPETRERQRAEPERNGSASAPLNVPKTNANASTSETQSQPMIVLQEIPTINQSEPTLPSNQPIMNARTRHQKILRRQMSDNELSPFSLTQEQLEEIVIHAAPVVRGRMNPGDGEEPGTSASADK